MNIYDKQSLKRRLLYMSKQAAQQQGGGYAGTMLGGMAGAGLFFDRLYNGWDTAKQRRIAQQKWDRVNTRMQNHRRWEAPEGYYGRLRGNLNNAAKNVQFTAINRQRAADAARAQWNKFTDMKNVFSGKAPASGILPTSPSMQQQWAQQAAQAARLQQGAAQNATKLVGTWNGAYNNSLKGMDRAARAMARAAKAQSLLAKARTGAWIGRFGKSLGASLLPVAVTAAGMGFDAIMNNNGQYKSNKIRA